MQALEDNSWRNYLALLMFSTQSSNHKLFYIPLQSSLTKAFSEFFFKDFLNCYFPIKTFYREWHLQLPKG